jgi:hypothetical protein
MCHYGQQGKDSLLFFSFIFAVLEIELKASGLLWLYHLSHAPSLEKILNEAG